MTGIVLRNPLAFAAGAEAAARMADAAATTPPGELLAPEVRAWLARARLLEGVPFQHIVADAELLPPESIRFFHLDREWTDALVQGALSVGTITTLDREQLQGQHAAIRAEVDAEERRVRMVGGENVAMAPAGPVSGFLLRSRAVSGWPALHVRAYVEDLLPDDANVPPNAPHRIRLLRLERLAPRCCSASSTACPPSYTSRSRARACSTASTSARKARRRCRSAWCRRAGGSGRATRSRGRSTCRSVSAHRA
jgi:hypothetical protein